MNDIKYSLSGPEEASGFMEWEGDSDLVRFDVCAGKDGTLPAHLNLSSTSYCQLISLEYNARKRKSDFSSPLPMKISRNIWNGEQQHEEHSSVNKMELHNRHVVASGFSVDKSTSQMTLVECHGVIGQVSDNVSTMSDEHSNVSIVSDQSNFRTFQTHSDLKIKKEKLHFPNAKKYTIHIKEKLLTCPICHSKWSLQVNLKRHVASHRTDDKLADTKHF